MSRILATLLVPVFFSVAALAAPKVGAPAPDFKVSDSNGKLHSLKDFQGKYLVLEWHNQGCPFVKKHYDTGNMQKLQKEWTGKGVAWLSVISSAAGKQGAVSAKDANDYVKKEKAAPTAVLLDTKQEMAKAYEAKTTPHMFVIDPKGTLIYAGAIDDKPSTDKDDVKTAKNYVSDALTASMAGKPVATASTQPYGCSVKYAD